LFNLTWKERITPAQYSIFALRASARRTSGSDCIGVLQESQSNKAVQGSGKEGSNPRLAHSTIAHWITPQTHDVTTRGNTMADHHYSPHDLSNQVELTSWPTPTSKFKAGGQYKDSDKAMARAMGPHANDLRDFAQMAAWPSPTTPSGGQTPQVTLKDVANLASWPTPTTRDHKDGHYQPNVPVNALLGRSVWAAGWPTPMAGTPKTDQYNEAGNTDSSRKTIALRGANIAGSGITPDPNWTGPARLTASGEIRIGSTAAMASGGQLRPGHSRWLMGCRAAWETSAPNYDDWRKWQDFLASLSEAQRLTVSEASGATATRSISSKPSSSSERLTP
jgi:hypothetical protein